jgi:hypothetical protein
MKTLPNQTASESAPDKANSSTREFLGTDNPRHLRAIEAFLAGPRPRERLDAEVGCSNGPQLVLELRRRGLDIPCKRLAVLDRDGHRIKRGVYHFSESDRVKVMGWQQRRKSGGQ